MGLFSWLKGGGALGGLATSVANVYREIEKHSATNDLDRYIRVVGFRYKHSPLPHANVTAGAVLHYMRRKVSQGEEFGLVALCFAIASREMDVVGIENHVLKTIIENLTKMGFSQEQMLGRTYSVEEFDTAIKGM